VLRQPVLLKRPVSRWRAYEMGTRVFFRVVLLAVVVVSTAVAGPLEDAMAALKRGDAVASMRVFADEGDPISQFVLGAWYRDGNGVQQDYAEAMRWFRKAADQGDPWAWFSIGELYLEGKGVPQDYVLAHMWFNLSAARLSERPRPSWWPSHALHEDAVRNRDLVASKMPPAQIAEAQKLAREWGCDSK
jgi:TPR repeat protein